MKQLRNPAAARWDFCAGILPRGIDPTDIDLLFEAGHGQFLALEGKQPGEEMPKGQRIALNRLASLPNFTVVEFVGVKPDGIQRYRRLPDPSDTGWKETTTAQFNTLIRRWFDLVES